MNNAPLRDAAARAAIRSELGSNLLVEAGAGSGKTQSLAERMVEAVGSGLCGVDEIAAVTFTRKAAAELRGRFRLELERKIAMRRGSNGCVAP
jgi:ATP-dependent helicase/nuclease subunit A